ncbi:MAG: hypothetical protein QXM75_00860 [Candidatus Diapherotrites archaeon]
MEGKKLFLGVALCLFLIFVFALLLMSNNSNNRTESLHQTGYATIEEKGEVANSTTKEATKPIFSGEVETTDKKTVVLYFFYGEGCPHCTKQKIFLEKMKEKYPNLIVKAYEVWKNEDNRKLFSEFAEAFGINARGVPTTFIGDFDPIIGFGSEETTGKVIEEKIAYCSEHGCIDAISKLR